jgi:hypothetical protein
MHSRRARSTSITSLLLALRFLAVVLPSHGADLTLTQAFLDSKNGFVDFKQISHTLAPGDRVLLEGHTRPSLMLVNLVYGSADNPIVVTNTGSAPFVIDNTAAGTSEGIKIWGAQHDIARATDLFHR